jgi:hypothetical protein
VNHLLRLQQGVLKFLLVEFGFFVVHQQSNWFDLGFDEVLFYSLLCLPLYLTAQEVRLRKHQVQLFERAYYFGMGVDGNGQTVSVDPHLGDARAAKIIRIVRITEVCHRHVGVRYVGATHFDDVPLGQVHQLSIGHQEGIERIMSLLINGSQSTFEELEVIRVDDGFSCKNEDLGRGRLGGENSQGLEGVEVAEIRREIILDVRGELLLSGVGRVVSRLH